MTKRKDLTSAKPRMPEYLRPLADKAFAKHMKRAIRPRIDIAGLEEMGTGWFACPYADEDAGAWEALLFESFGTRSPNVVNAFLAHLAALSPREWQSDAEAWGASQQHLDLMLAIISAMRPKDEAQAALAAQLCALNITNMRLAQRTCGVVVDPMTVAVQAKVTRAYADGLLALQKLQGRGKSSRQTISSRSDRHVHFHRHGGGSKDRGQSHATGRTSLVEASVTVPGESPVGRLVPIASGKG